MFRVIDQNLTTIFNKTQNVSNGFNLASNEVEKFVNRFNSINKSQNFGLRWDTVMQAVNNRDTNVAAYFEDLAKQGASARASIEGVYAAILNGNTRGISNVKSIVSAYNAIGNVSPENQQAFASAVSQTNSQLGSYLINLQGGNASLKGYTAQLVATTAKTLVLKAATIALNTALVAGISWLINKGFQYLSEWYKSQKELQELAIESAQAYKDQAESMKDLVSQYETILDSEKSDAEKTIELNKWKQTLVETYKIERDELRKLNTDREYGIQLLEDEIDATNRRNRNKWLGENKESVDTAISKINSTQIGAFTIDDNSIYDNIKQYVKGSMGGTYSVIGDNLIEQYDNLERIIEYFGSKSELSTAENDLLKKLNKEKDKAEKILDEYRDNYETYYQYTAQNLLDSYAVDDKAIENVSQETYEAWKDGLIATANGDKEIEKALSSMLEEQFPDYETYFSSYYKNLAEAQNKFVNSIHVNSQDDAVLAQQISEYIGSLDEQDLSILLTFDENAFDEGIGIVKRKIAKFKQENPVEVNFKISDYQEQIESVSGNIKTLQDALDKLDNNEFDFTNDIYDLANAFPEYSTEILNASGDTEKLREVLQGILDIQPNDLINSLTKLKGSLTSDEDIRAVDNLVRILKNSTSSTEALDALVQSFDDLSSAVSTFTKNQTTLTDAFEEQEKHGQLSADTIQSLTEAGYAQALSVNAETGAITLNKKALEELNQQKQIEIELDLDKKETDLITAYEEEKTKISELNKELAHTNSLRAQEIINELTALEVTHKLTAEQLAQVRALKKSLTAPNYGSSGSSGDDDKPKSVSDFETELAKRQHEINLGLRKEDASYYDWLEQAAHKAYDGLADYEEDLWKYEEQVYEWRKDHEQDLFDQKIENLDKEKEKALENNDFSTAKTSVNTQITETRKRIVELKTSGKQDVDDEIKQLEEDLGDLNDTLNEISSQEYEFNISVIKDNVDEQIEALDRNIENTGDTKLYSEKIKVYKDGQQQILDMIEFYRKQGYAEDSAIIKELKKQWNDYQDSISDALQEQANAQVEAYNELLDEQKELLEQQKEAQDEYYDSEIKALEDKKEALEKVNETIEKQNELEEKRQAIAEAERNLYKNVRLVYSGGQWVQKAREEDLQAVKDAEKDLSDTLRKQEIEALENQITALNDAKDEYDEAIDKQITAIEESEKAFEKAMENSYKVRQQLDYEFISAIVGNDKAKEYQTNVDNALKAIAEAEKTDSADNSALIDSNNAVAETNREVAESNLQKLSADDALKSIYNSFQKTGALLKGTTFEKFAGNIQNSALNATLNTPPKIADDIVKGSMVNNYTVNNSPTITNNITNNISGVGLGSEELANEIATTCNSAIGQAFSTYERTFNNTLTKIMYGNT